MKRRKDDLDRYLEKAIKRDPSLKERLEKADRAWDIAFQVYDLRKKAGLTQAQLAKLVGTKQSNIARLESADYTAYTFKTLEKITKALKARLEIRIVPKTNSKPASLFRA
ncbi:helix-turn-helix transcriptional regulator [Candidatus Curtissbacteria bacterium]|nr:helix-turn-helix transcriptional regulator [Candidatus Curtissbacteria bacterium]